MNRKLFYKVTQKNFLGDINFCFHEISKDKSQVLRKLVFQHGTYQVVAVKINTIRDRCCCVHSQVFPKLLFIPKPLVQKRCFQMQLYLLNLLAMVSSKETFVLFLHAHLELYLHMLFLCPPFLIKFLQSECQNNLFHEILCLKISF